MTQAEQILKRLISNSKPLTPKEAVNRFNCYRLAARIYDLKAKGHRINSKLVKRGDTTVAAYWMA